MMACRPTPLIWTLYVRILPSSLRWCVFHLDLPVFVADVSFFVSRSYSVEPSVKILTLSTNTKTPSSMMHYDLQACSLCRKRVTTHVSHSTRRSLGEAATCLSDSARLSLSRARSCAGASCSFWMKVWSVASNIMPRLLIRVCLQPPLPSVSMRSRLLKVPEMLT